LSASRNIDLVSLEELAEYAPTDRQGHADIDHTAGLAGTSELER
jgi:hypothetical protein